MKEFEHEAIDVIKQIEDKTIGFPVRLPQFYGACGKACSKLPGADVDHILKTIFGMLPAKFATFGCSRPLADFLMEVAEKIKEERKKRESRGEEEEEEDEEFDSDDDMEEPPQRTDFLPYTESQFKQACEKAKLVPKENTEEFQSCFQFTKPEPIKFDKNSRFIKKLDLLENIETEIGDLAEVGRNQVLLSPHFTLDVQRMPRRSLNRVENWPPATRRFPSTCTKSISFCSGLLPTSHVSPRRKSPQRANIV